MTTNNWIYQFSEPLDDVQTSALRDKTGQFLANWKAHGTPVPAKFKLLENQFLLITAVPGSTSGCSIDALEQHLKTIFSEVEINTLPVSFLPFRTEERSPLFFLDFRKVEEALLNGRLTGDSIFYDQTALQKGLFGSWKTTVAQSWLEKYLSPASV